MKSDGNDDHASGRARAVIYDPSNNSNDDNSGLKAAVAAADQPPELASQPETVAVPPKLTRQTRESSGSNSKSSSGQLGKTAEVSPSRERKKSKKSKSNLVKSKDGFGAPTNHKADLQQGSPEPVIEDNSNSGSSEKRRVQTNGDGFGGKKCNSQHKEDLSRNQGAQENKVTPSRTTTTNLIRRDDSWQSLVSLTRVGKVRPAMQGKPSIACAYYFDPTLWPQLDSNNPHCLYSPGSHITVAQRSLYAQHIMPGGDGAREDKQFSGGYQANRIESTATPSRVSLSASSYRQQQQISSAVNQRKFRPLPPLAGHLPHAPASFDVSAPNSPALSNQQQQQQQQRPSLSYQQKLIQLQLLHNSNNVDYIRQRDESNSNDYGIYDASASQLYGYGYSSMRSQLKSAASEFSFIRPTSSSTRVTNVNNAVPGQPHAANFLLNHHQSAAQSTLPQPDHQQSYVFHSPNTRAAAGKLILSNSSLGVGPAASKANAINESDNNNNDLGAECMSPLAKQYLVHPITGERIINQSHQALAAPMRELPLKPNKRRAGAGGLLAAEAGPGGQANATCGGSTKSNSLTASIACFFRRAFSRRSKPRGSKKRKSKLAESSSSLGAFADDANVCPLVPSAFSTGSKSVNGQHPQQQQQRMVDMIEAFTNQTRLTQQQQQARPHNLESFDLDVSVGTPRQRKVQAQGLNQQFGGSPLHKSNSISATMGLSYGQYGADTNGALLYDNALIAGGSPMMARSSKVLSANLTPLLNRGAYLEQGTGGSNQQQQQQRYFLSPRNSHMPRPSSIYGQPSMISSPVFAGRDAADRSHQFGAHRNSFHNQHFRDRGPSDDLRRHHQVPFSLDTTREVNEDIASPVASEPPPLLAVGAALEHKYSARRDGIAASPSSGKLYQRHKAIVNPILQSPTMSTIYDNHPIVMQNNVNGDYSHYDNHSSHMQPSSSPSLIRSKLSTPSHHQRSVFEANERALSMLINEGKKPSAIVAPTTPTSNHNYTSGSNSPKFRGDLCAPGQQHNFHAQPIQSPIIQHRQQASRSPMLARRVPSGQHYQQSPLVSQQTRVLNKGDGVQATILDAGGWAAQPVVNIAGAPGINLDPTLAASLLKGTNIEAYESSTYDCGSMSSNSQSNSSNNNNNSNKPKTFLVSTRLSKSLAYSGQSAALNDTDAGSTSRDELSSQVSTANLRDDLSSSGSRSINSSIGERGLARKSSRVSTATSSSGAQLEDPGGGAESSGSDTRGEPRSVIVNNGRRKGSQQSRRSSVGSCDQVEDAAAFDDVDVDGLGSDRNWITSKLAAVEDER